MLTREDRGSVAVVRLSHGKASVLDLELLRALDDEFRAIEQSDRSAVVLTGTGSIFSAGVDLFRIVNGGRAYVDQFLPALTTTFRRLFELPLPTVAAINGHAIAGGGILVQCCDLRLLARGDGRIGFPELLVGVPFPPFAIELLRAALPAASLHRLALSGETVRPERALEAGLVDELCDPEALLGVAIDRAERLGAIPRDVFAMTKRNLRRPAIEHYERRGQPIEEEVAAVWRSPEAIERIRAYLDKTLSKRG